MSRVAARAACAAALLACCGAAAAYDAGSPDDPAAQSAAVEALAKLGPGRGARELKPDVRTLKGLKAGVGGGGLALTAKVEQLEQAIKDLGAEVKPMEIQVELASDVLFDFDKADIKPAAQAELEKLALIIREKRRGDVRIAGHTDAKGSEAYNQKLSERRAEAVKAWLADKGGIDPGVMKTRGYGETQPVAPNTKPDGTDDPEGRQKNRRVEIVIQTGG
jgi:outer membrane protein OmpA-like peptidoglycan-associated protein